MANEKKMWEIIVIGGSAGSFSVVSKILEKVPRNLSVPIVLCLHRLKDKREGFKEALEIKSNIPVREPCDKDKIEKGVAYLAPSNYHLLIESKEIFALSTTELVQYSRPSIDVLFESAADTYKGGVLGLLLSGANRDGALGMSRIKSKGGFTIVQDPKDASMPTMPAAAIETTTIDLVLDTSNLVSFFANIEKNLFIHAAS
ncbi:MAG: chemotaxis protein CheB [Bacteroidia bacterium]|nr:chemotaxis protein CheB [Bacteroidia bacterium]MDW8159388.1 chemotaxis protein CheB [Bacteroidia bacterium]